MASALQIPAAIAAQILRRQDDGSSGSSAGDAGQDTPDADSDDPCGPSKVSNLGLRTGAIFVILVTSLCGTLFPILARRVTWLRKRTPGAVFEFAKYFGSGVITATALIHLLEPAADDELGPANTIALGGCIANSWSDYPYAFGICLISLYFIFVVEMIAFRVGTAKLKKWGIGAQPHGFLGANHGNGGGIEGSEGLDDAARDAGAPGQDHQGSPNVVIPTDAKRDMLKEETGTDTSSDFRFQDSSEASPAVAQILGVAILECGVILHSVIIGLTLSTSDHDEYVTLFIVIIFHQMFEGLGLGSRLAFLQLPSHLSWVPIVGAVLYSFVTPLGMGIGLATRSSISLTAAGASITSGILDSISAGILLYTATVELMAHEFVFNEHYLRCSWGRLSFALICFALGAGIMALLGKWA